MGIRSGELHVIENNNNCRVVKMYQQPVISPPMYIALVAAIL